METPIKNFKISTKRHATPLNKPNLHPVPSKTPQKFVKTHIKSQSPSKPLLKSFKSPRTMLSNPNINIILESKKEVSVEDNIAPKILLKEPDINKRMISLYFRHRIRSLLYSVYRRDIAQNMKLDIISLMTSLTTPKNVKNPFILLINNKIVPNNKRRHLTKACEVNFNPF